MPGPSLPTVYEQNMTERINDFYGNASIFKNNMFFVGLWGEYVEAALEKMKNSTNKDPFLNLSRSGQTKGVDTFGAALSRWEESHLNKDNGEVELKWTCSKIKIPTVESKTEKQEFSIDTIKPISYSLTQSYGGVGEVTLNITDNRNMMMWHFFNTLHNQFYDTQILKPKSSFHKVGMYCAILQGDTISNANITNEFGTKNGYEINDVPAMVYEFNSANIIDVGGIEFSQENPGMFTFTVRIEVPNTFQGTFKTHFRGLANNTSSTGYTATSAIDSNSISGGTYAGLKVNQPTSQSYFESDFDSSK